MILQDSTIQQFNNSTIQQFNHSTIQPFNHSTIQQFNHSTIQQFNNSTIQQFNNSTIQQFNNSTLLEIFTVAGLATFEIYAAIPAGFAFGMHPGTIFMASLIGGLVGVFVAAFLGDQIRAFFNRNKEPKLDKPKEGLIYRLWDKYGVIGVGFLGTMTVGAPISLAVGVGFNVPLKKLIVWCCMGVLVRCALFTTIGHFGMKLI